MKVSSRGNIKFQRVSEDEKYLAICDMAYGV